MTVLKTDFLYMEKCWLNLIFNMVGIFTKIVTVNKTLTILEWPKSRRRRSRAAAVIIESAVAG
jgi:hypothetical protein